MTTTSTRVFQLFSGLTWTLLQACGGAASGGYSDDFQVADEAVEQADPDGNQAVECPVNLICQLCDDGSCAEPHVEVVDGECGPVTYSCAAGSTGNASSGATTSPPGEIPPSGATSSPPGEIPPSGATSSPPGEIPPSGATTSPPGEIPPSGATTAPPDDLPCSVPAICQLCDDGACATPEVEYKDGECGAVRFVCPTSAEGSTGEAVDLN
jgi:hypothetical protein